MTFDHVWYWKARLPERKGQRCAILWRFKRMNSLLIQFEDGVKYVVSRYAVRQSPAPRTREGE